MARDNRTLRFHFTTWNVATKYPDGEPHELLGIAAGSSEPLPDFFVIGLQEVKSQPRDMVMDIFFEDPWTKFFRDVLKEKDYVKVRTQRLQGLVLNVFCQRNHVAHLRLIEARYTKTGFGGMWGNKGAVSIRFNIYGINICIVNCHLTPHDHLLADRISDYNTILRDHVFNVPETRNIMYHDYTFWIGDLNFRLAGEDLSGEDINSLVMKKELDRLLDRDQLKMVMASGEAFAELNENKVTFPPTYKFEFSSQNYDLKRRPSWTDRILYKVNSDVYEDITLKAIQKSYDSHPSYVLSDHKPVTGEFDISTRPDYEVHGVEFQPVGSWFLDEENSMTYKLLGDAQSSSGDWIGLFNDGFSSLDDYLVYEYVGYAKTNTNVESTTEPRSITERIFFSDTALRSPGMYRLVYVAQRGYGITGILGISPPFSGERRLSGLLAPITSIN